MGCGGSCASAGIKTQESGQIPPKYSSSSKRCEFFPFCTEQLMPMRSRFPGQREIPRPHALPSTFSTWTLVDPEVHLERQARPRPDPPRQDTQEVNDPGPYDSSAGSPPQPEPEPQPSVDIHKVTTPSEPIIPKAVDAVGTRKENAPATTQTDPPPPRRPVSKFRKFIKSMSLCFLLQIQREKRWLTLS
jgi:hypothetical protein